MCSGHMGWTGNIGAEYKATVDIGFPLLEIITINMARSVDPGSPLAKNGLFRRIQKAEAMCINISVSGSTSAARNCHFK